MKLSARLLPRSITTQITAIVAISVLLGMAVTAAIMIFLIGLTDLKDTPSAIVSRIVTVTRSIQSAKNPAEADILLGAAQNAGVRVERAAIADLKTMPSGSHLTISSWGIVRQLETRPGIDVLKRLLYANGPAEQLVVRLDGDHALIFDAATGRSPWLLLLTPTTLALIIVLVFVLLLSVYAVRWIIAPLSAVAEAALSFGRSPRNDQAIGSAGPREIVQVADALNEMRTRIRALLEDRTRMLAAISHDLRTPLTRLRLRAERVREDSLRDGMLGDLIKVSRMLDETLDYLREEGKSEAISLADLPSLLQTICSDFTDVGHAVSYQGPARLTWTVRPRALTRAVTNIVENGIKHGSAVTVALRSAARESIEIEIADDGPGIPATLRHKVFEPFFKVDNARAQNGAGFGLGLSIAQDIVKRHGGEIGLQARDPAGLAVRILLPADMSLNMT
jgi:signal transduction histidine kinase